MIARMRQLTNVIGIYVAGRPALHRPGAVLVVILLVIAETFSGGSSSWAQVLLSELLSEKASEEAQIRLELERIIAENSFDAANARKALDGLNQPGGSPAGRQARNRRQEGNRRIVNGIATTLYPAVGALLRGGDPKTAKAWCSGTLVGCDKFLTAAHCLAANEAVEDYLIFFPQLGFSAVKAIAKGQYTPKRHGYFDLAMLTLARPVEGISPIRVNTRAKATPLFGFKGTIVGFGRTGGSRYDFGIKREGSIKTKRCPATYVNSKVFCWSFDADVRSDASASNTCFGDSGGGIFMPDDDGGRRVLKVFGVVSGGRDRSCVKDDLSYNVDVGQFAAWIEAAGEGRLSSEMCGRSSSVSNMTSAQSIVHLGERDDEVLLALSSVRLS